MHTRLHLKSSQHQGLRKRPATTSKTHTWSAKNLLVNVEGGVRGHRVNSLGAAKVEGGGKTDQRAETARQVMKETRLF